MWGASRVRRLSTPRTSTVSAAMNTLTTPRTVAKAPATFARMLVLAQRRFDARRPPPAGRAASTSTPASTLRHWPAGTGARPDKRS